MIVLAPATRSPLAVHFKNPTNFVYLKHKTLKTVLCHRYICNERIFFNKTSIIIKKLHLKYTQPSVIRPYTSAIYVVSLYLAHVEYEKSPRKTFITQRARVWHIAETSANFIPPLSPWSVVNTISPPFMPPHGLRACPTDILKDVQLRIQLNQTSVRYLFSTLPLATFVAHRSL